MSESTWVTSRRAMSRAESAYTAGLKWGRPRFRKPRALPHSPARKRPARRWPLESLVACARVTRPTPSLSCAMPRVAVRSPSRKRSCSGVGGAGTRVDSAGVESGTGGVGSCAASGVAAMQQRRAARQRIEGPLSGYGTLGYNGRMTVPATSRQIRAFEDRADALAHFFLRAGEAPRLLAYDDDAGCPLDQALAVIEWTAAVGILAQEDLIHAARLTPDTAAAVVERKDGDQRVFVYFGPRMDAPPADPYEGTLLYDEPGVRAYIFAQRVHAIAHFLRATHGIGAVIAMLGRRAPELRHIRRWLQALFSEPVEGPSTQLLAGWFATGGAGVLFIHPHPGEPYTYHEVGIDI